MDRPPPRDEGRQASDWADQFVRQGSRESSFRRFREEHFVRPPIVDFWNENQDQPDFVQRLGQLPIPGVQEIATAYEALPADDKLTIRKTMYFGDLVWLSKFRRFQRSKRLAEHGQVILDAVKPWYDPFDPKTHALVHYDENKYDQLVFQGKPITDNERGVLYLAMAWEDRQRPLNNLDNLQFFLLNRYQHPPKDFNERAEEMVRRYGVDELRKMTPGHLMTVQAAIESYGTPEQNKFLSDYYWSGFGKFKQDARGYEGDTTGETHEDWKREIKQIARSIEPSYDHIPDPHELADALDAQGLEPRKADHISFIYDVREEMIRIIVAPVITALRENGQRSDSQIRAALSAIPKVGENDRDEVLNNVRLNLIDHDANTLIAERIKSGEQFDSKTIMNDLRNKGYDGLNEMDEDLIDIWIKIASQNKGQ